MVGCLGVLGSPKSSNRPWIPLHFGLSELSLVLNVLCLVWDMCWFPSTVGASALATSRSQTPEHDADICLGF